jgi:hypothetical protein
VSDQEIKLLKRIAASVLAGIGWFWGACEHSRAERLQRELEEERGKNQSVDWRERIQQGEKGHADNVRRE